MAMYGYIQQYTPIMVKFGMEEYTMGPYSHAKFGLDWGRGGYRSPRRFQNLVEIKVLSQFFAPQGRQYISIKAEMWHTRPKHRFAFA